MIIQVSSHRRSGTHALIDLIRENFTVEGDFFHLEDVMNWPLEELKETVVIVKTHEPEPEKKLNNFVRLGKLTKEKAAKINALTSNIHAYRNPKDVLKSLYYFNIKGHEPVYKIPETISFLDFLQQENTQDAAHKENRIQFWQRTVRNWALHEDVLALDYENIVHKQREVLESISLYLSLELKSIVDSKNLVKKSTAVGRNTTKNMATFPLWTEETEKYYYKEIDSNLLNKLNIKYL